MAPPLRLLTALALSGGAQLALRSGRQTIGVAAALAALGLGVAAAGFEPAPRRALEPPASSPRWRPPRPGCLGIGALALAAVLVLQALDRAYGVQLAFWALSAVAWSAAWIPRPPLLPRIGEAGLVAVLLGFGLAARFYELEWLPGGLYGDEAEFGLRALAVLDGTGRIAPFSVVFDQHPALFHWVQAAGMGIAGRDIAGLRSASALAGALTLLPIYALLRRDLGAAGAAAGALLLACSPLHAHLTRIASNNAWVGLASVAALAALYRLLRTGLPSAAVQAGSWLGFCFLFGNKAVGLPPAMALAFAGAALGGNVALRRCARPSVLLLAAALLVSLPEGVYYLRTGWYGPLLDHPMRALVDLDATGGPGAPAGVASRLANALLTFLVLPDRSPFQVRTGFPIVAAAEGAFLLVGVALALGRPRAPFSGFLLGWLLVGIGTCALDRNPPQANHLIGVSALPSVFAAFAAHALARALADWLARPGLAPALTLAIAAAIAAQSTAVYLPAGRSGWVVADLTEIGRAMNERAPTQELALVTPPMSWDLISTWKFMAPGVRAQHKLVELDPQARWLDPGGRDVAFIVHPSKLGHLPTLRARYPSGVLEERRSPLGRLLAVVYTVPAADVARIEPGLPLVRTPATRGGAARPR